MYAYVILSTAHGDVKINLHSDKCGSYLEYCSKALDGRKADDLSEDEIEQIKGEVPFLTKAFAEYNMLKDEWSNYAPKSA